MSVVTVKYEIECHLCGQPVEIKGFTITAGQKELAFCCAGCLSIYRLIYKHEPSNEPNNTIKKNEEKE